MGFRLVTSARCGGGFFAGFASGFRWCLAVLSRSPGGCCFGRVWARLRCVLCPRAGACFFSFMGFRLVTSARCGGGFFAGFASGFRWCLAVLSRSREVAVLGVSGLGCVAFCVHAQPRTRNSQTPLLLHEHTNANLRVAYALLFASPSKKARGRRISLPVHIKDVYNLGILAEKTHAVLGRFWCPICMPEKR